MTDPAKLSLVEIETELADLAVRLREANEVGGKVAELEGRKWRYEFELRYRWQK